MNLNLIKFIFVLIFLFCQESQDTFFDKGLTPIETGFETEKSKLSASYCKSCHAKSHSTWEDSIHRKSWKNSLFQHSFELEPMDWCIHCHAPLISQKKEIYLKKSGKNSLSDEGINCASCHLRKGKIYGNKKNQNSFHEVIVEKNFGSPEYCASCHEFNFPTLKSGSFKFSHEPMQSTYSEYRKYGSEKKCNSCHMENHFVKGPHSKNFLRSIFATAEFEFEENVLFIAIEIIKKRAHHLPSGDLFRSLSIELSYDNFKTKFFTKKFARFYKMGQKDSGTIWNRELEYDSSIKPTDSLIRVAVDIVKKKKIDYRLLYYFHDPELGGESKAENSFLILQEKKLNP